MLNGLVSRSSRGVCFLGFAFTRKLLGEGFFIRAIRGGVGKSSFKSALCLTEMSPSQKFKVESFLPVIDKLIICLNQRLQAYIWQSN